MSSARLRSDLFVAAHLRICGVNGIEAVLRCRGAEEAGAIFISLDCLDGQVSLYGPAPQSLLEDHRGGRLFTVILPAATSLDVEERMRRERRFDPDLWWLEIADRGGRHLLDLTPDPSATG